MSSITYHDFKLEVTAINEEDYRVRVQPPAGPAESVMCLPLGAGAIQSFLREWEQQARTRKHAAREKTRKTLHPDEAKALDFGTKLFDALFHGNVEKCYRRMLQKPKDEGLRVMLHLKAPNLAALPWEYMYDAKLDSYLFTSRYQPLVRHMLDLRQSAPLKIDLPLRILGMVSCPEGKVPLDVEAEKALVRKALGDLEEKDVVKLTWTDDATLDTLQDYLEQPWHVFHFIGHGEFRAKKGEGQLVFEDKSRRSDPRGADEFGPLLHDCRPLRLVVLNACEGARGSLDDINSSVAAALTRQSIPATVAMQFTITDDAAMVFAGRFYRAIASGFSIEAAVGEARKAMRIQHPLEWGTPALYMSYTDGVLFEPSGGKPVEPIVEEEPPQEDPAPRPRPAQPTKSHLAREIGPESEVLCSLCSVSLSLKNLASHWRMTHPNADKYQRELIESFANSYPSDTRVACPICKEFVKAKNLVSHWDKLHQPKSSTPKPKCPHCGQSKCVGMKFCIKTGHPMETVAQTQCPHCGEARCIGMKYCTQTGKPMT